MSNINDNNLFTLGLDISATKELMTQQLKQIAQELSNSQVMKITCTINKSETQREISQQLNNLIQNSSSRKTGNIKITADTRNALTSIKDVNKSLLSTTKTAKSFGEVVKSSFNFSVYLTIVREITRILRNAMTDGIEAVKEYDNAITNLRMATNGTYEETRKLVDTYNEMGKALGSTTSEVSEAADAWLRQGNSISDTNTLIKDSMILSKVGQLESADATQYLTSAMKGYKLSADEALSVVDKLTSVDLVSATDAGGLAEAMSRTATTADMAGVSMDKLLGYLAVTGEVTQK